MRARIVVAVLLLCFLGLPVFAAPCDNPIRALTPSDAQTGTPVFITWSLGGVVPQSIQLTGHDFEQPVVLAPNQTSYAYVPDTPGEKHVTLTVVTDCGTFTKTQKYHVQQCNVIAPALHLDRTTVAPGGTINASIDLLPGHTARWVVFNGTPSATSGASIQVTAGTSGSVSINVFVARGNSCEVSTGNVVPIEQPCSIAEPLIQTSPVEPAAGAPFSLYLPSPRVGETATFVATGAELLQTGSNFIAVIAPATGSFSIGVTLSKNGCSRTFTRTFTVTPCAPTATVNAANTNSCDSGTLIADFTGHAPFQGYWSDGEYFFTNGTHLERTVTVAGTYTISNFIDASCSGTVSGSAQVGASLPVPEFALDDMVDGWYYATDTCPGLVRTARLTAPAPAGAQIVWSVENGTIVSGQGTDVVQFTGTNPGPTPLSVVFRNAEGCNSQPAVNPWILTQGAPEIAVSVEPSMIGAGGTAVVTMTMLNNFVRSSGVSSSLGDPLVFLDGTGNTIRYEYRSTSGGGVATITANANNSCGQSATATTTLTIDGGTPVGAQARVRAFGSSCQDYGVIAELSGIAPFTGKWSTGDTFIAYDPYAFLYPTGGGTYTLVEFADANGPGTITGEATFDFVGLPRPEFTLDPAIACPNGTVTATLTTPVPDGATVNWFVYGANIVSGQGTPSIQIQLGEFGVSVNVQVTAPGACSPMASAYLPLDSYVQGPFFDLYGVYDGYSTDIWVTLDPKTASWGFENTLGDAMEIVGNPYPNTYIVRYTSSHGPGQSTVRIYGTTQCGTAFEASRVMTVLPAPPSVTLASEQGESCGATVTATITGGTAPYTVWWSDTGESVTTSSTTVTHFVSSSTYLYVVVTDANGATAGSPYTYVDAKILPYLGVSGPSELCAGTTTTLTAYGAPEGAEIIWWIDGANAQIVSGQGTTQLTIEALSPGYFYAMAKYRTAEGCESFGSGLYMHVPDSCGQTP